MIAITYPAAIVLIAGLALLVVGVPFLSYRVARGLIADHLRAAADDIDAMSEEQGGLYAGDCSEILRARADEIEGKP